jgi:hypothetical protein
LTSSSHWTLQSSTCSIVDLERPISKQHIDYVDKIFEKEIKQLVRTDSIAKESPENAVKKFHNFQNYTITQ